MIAVLGVLVAMVVIAVTAVAPRTGVSASLLLVVLGVGISFLPFVPAVIIPPELILIAVLPPLLYSGSALLPTMDLRRDMRAVGGLSVLLVVVTALALGVMFWALLPNLSLAGGIALGAVVSPTDAVATWIARRMGAPPRLTVVLEGESLLNDATALTTLRAAIAASAATVSVWEMVGSFAWAMGAAALCGVLTGLLGLVVRRPIDSAALSTSVSFVVPFVAFLAAELIGASGLVAVVTAGLTTGWGAAIYLTPQDRAAEHSNWRTVELLLEGGAFLFMGLSLFGIIEEVHAERGSIWLATGIATLAIVALVLVRAAFIGPLLWSLARRAKKLRAGPEVVERLGQLDRTNVLDSERGNRWLRHLAHRRDYDVAYLRDRPFGLREGVLLIASGMRGVTTVVAAQTLPRDFPYRSTLILIAFWVAAGTLLIQGSTIAPLIRALGLADQDGGSATGANLLRHMVGEVGREVLEDPGLRRPDGSAYDDEIVARTRAVVVLHDPPAEDVTDADTEVAETGVVEALERDRSLQYRELRMRVIREQRAALLRARAAGAHSSRDLEHALAVLDAQQINLDMAYPAVRPMDHYG